MLHELEVVASAMESIISHKEQLETFASEFLQTTRNFFFIGRGFDYYVCLEGALKLSRNL